jgi:hypothetical protein
MQNLSLYEHYSFLLSFKKRKDFQKNLNFLIYSHAEY